MISIETAQLPGQVLDLKTLPIFSALKRRVIVAGCNLVRTTSHLRVEREQPLIVTYSLFSENILNYYFYLKHVRKGE